MDNQEINLKKEIRSQTAGYILAAFGIVAGLAWNEAIKSLIAYLFPFQASSLLMQFIYAIGITLVVVVVSIYLTRAQKN
ncbi:MAG: DUF5654 family protein [Patescibacteria group bacterium]|jgi:hypothetical protein